VRHEGLQDACGLTATTSIQPAQRRQHVKPPSDCHEEIEISKREVRDIAKRKDNQALLQAVKRCVGKGGKATLVGAPDADILLEAIEELRKRTTARAATFLVKVKAHRGELANEETDIQADKAISGKDVPTEWHDRTNQVVFTWQEPRRKGGTVSYEDHKST